MGFIGLRRRCVRIDLCKGRDGRGVSKQLCGGERKGSQLGRRRCFPFLITICVVTINARCDSLSGSGDSAAHSKQGLFIAFYHHPP